MRKLFVSQPMLGLSDEEILAERKRTVALVERVYGETFDLIDSFIVDVPTDASPLYYLGRSLEKLAEADLAVFSNGWKGHRGCRIEYTACIEYGIEAVDLDDTEDTFK